MSEDTSTANTGVRVQADVLKAPWPVLLSRPVGAIVTLVLLAWVLEFIPGADQFRVFSASTTEDDSPRPAFEATTNEIGEAELTTESRSQPGMAQPEEILLPKSARGPIAGENQPALSSIDTKQPPVAIEDASGRALLGFYRALEKTQKKEPGAITRILHFGDSIVVSDYVSGTLRRKFQKQFGDAGHGYSLIANAWPAYFHNDVYRFASSGWKVSRIVGPVAPDGFYGLGGVSFKAPPGARARFGTAKKGSFGRAVSRFTVVYLEHPAGGKFKLNLDGEFHSEIDSHSERKQAAYATVETSDGEHELEILTSGGMTRMFGVVMERSTPGVVLDALGVQGARIRFLDKQDDEHWAEQLEWRAPNLVIYQFGANESGDGFAYPMDEYNKTMTAVLEQGRRAVPEAGCLVLSAMDRASKKGDLLRSMRIIPMIVKEQRAAAHAVGCAFFDIFDAMKQGGGMPAWVRRGLGQADLTHPTGVGSEVLARWIYRALMKGYNQFLKTPKAAAPPP